MNLKNVYRYLEGILLAIVLCVAALRLSFIETPQNIIQTLTLWTTARGISLIISSILFLTILIGFFLRIHKIRWSPSWQAIVAGLFLFASTTLLAIFSASDKRAAETECITLVVPAIMAMMASRWLDSVRRIDVAVWVILSIGCAAVYVSIDQSMESNRQILEDYRKNPTKQLATLGIEPNSFAHFQYEHRLMSQDVRGFLTTSNSTGSFLLIGIFIALGLLSDTLQAGTKEEGIAARLSVLLLILFALIAGLLIGQSRGALATAILILPLFGLLRFWGKWVWKYRLPVLITAGVMFVLIWVVAVGYGVEHGRLPGPNAMFVRWQYWVGSVRMAADHPLLGVGGGNFATLYTQYKIPAAPETVKDPHNFVLSLLCQFGPLSIAGFAVAVFAILRRGLKTSLHAQSDLAGSQDNAASLSKDKIFPFITLVGVTFTLLYFRPIVIDGGVPGETPLIRQSVFVILYLIPAFFFVCTYGLLWTTSPKTNTDRSNKGLTLGLICGVAAILTHNLIDFAIFEPGIWTTFWLVLAMILALAEPQWTIEQKTAQCGRQRWVISAAMILLVGGLFFVRVYKPIASGRELQIGLGDYEKAQNHFEMAAKIDPFDPEPYFIAAQWTQQRYKPQPLKPTNPLEKTLNFLTQAQRRNPLNYRYPQMVSEILKLQSDAGTDKGKELLNSSYQSLLEAQQLYPGSDQIAYDLGQLAEKLGRPQDAAKHYLKAVEIEDQYRLQFAQMYPDTPLFSRLGQSKYDYANNYLSKQVYLK